MYYLGKKCIEKIVKIDMDRSRENENEKIVQGEDCKKEPNKLIDLLNSQGLTSIYGQSVPKKSSEGPFGTGRMPLFYKFDKYIVSFIREIIYLHAI